MAWRRTHILCCERLFDRYFSMHRHHVENAKPRIDTTAPLLTAHIFSKVNHFKEKCQAMKLRVHDNTELLKRVNELYKNYSLKYLYNETFELNKSKLPLNVRRLQQIETSNLNLAFRLQNAKAHINTNFKKRRDEKTERQHTVPNYVLKYFKTVVSPDMHVLLHTLLRPRIYFDLEVRGVHPLGRIVIQLFSEACPDVVMEFVRLCHESNTERFRILRVFPELWLDGEFKLYEQKLTKPGFLYDLYALPNLAHSGVLSFCRKYYEKGFTNGSMSFAISFKPLTLMDHDRLTFGVVTDGLRWLSCIRDFGTKCGKTKKHIHLMGCGLLTD